MLRQHNRVSKSIYNVPFRQARAKLNLQVSETERKKVLRNFQEINSLALT